MFSCISILGYLIKDLIEGKGYISVFLWNWMGIIHIAHAYSQTRINRPCMNVTSLHPVPLLLKSKIYLYSMSENEIIIRGW